MKKTLGFAALAVALAALSGCGGPSNRIVGNRLERSGQWFGDLGVTGHLNKVTIENGSRIRKLSIVGNANEVALQDDVTCGKIEVWGADNVVIVPDDLILRDNQVGHRSRIVRRPANWKQPVGTITTYQRIEAAEDYPYAPYTPAEGGTVTYEVQPGGSVTTTMQPASGGAAPAPAPAPGSSVDSRYITPGAARSQNVPPPPAGGGNPGLRPMPQPQPAQPQPAPESEGDGSGAIEMRPVGG